MHVMLGFKMSYLQQDERCVCAGRQVGSVYLAFVVTPTVATRAELIFQTI